MATWFYPHSGRRITIKKFMRRLIDALRKIPLEKSNPEMFTCEQVQPILYFFLAENYLLPVALLSIQEFFCFLTIFLLMPLSFKKQIGVASTYINITRCQSCSLHKDKADKLFKNWRQYFVLAASNLKVIFLVYAICKQLKRVFH